MKKAYRIPLVWQMYGHLYVDAESEEEAKRIALDSETPLPDNGDYVCDSCMIDEECPIEAFDTELN